ncbi:transglycosylase family protein [Kitasatospora sp. NBC_01246]|uniref:transglycosylase family protein n=1 Tax=Kitasatospora sp. NBC_01246 TaxID=2903570 RepID=UPI002E2FF023|nr:transglycosylase family protein [Kitasatospora sp. NBC_01246]
MRSSAAGALLAPLVALVLAVALALVLLPAVVPLPAGRARAASTVADMIWDELAECESGGDWRAATGNGYFGGLQIWPPTWEEAGGLRFADRPDRASRRQQTTVAEEILHLQGWEAWPACAREIGMIGGGSDRD